MRNKLLNTLILIAATALSTSASAHLGTDSGTHHTLVDGLLHPLTGLDHLAAMLAVGLWSALVARRAWPDLLWAPVGFAAMLLVGALAGLQGLEVPGVEPMIAASLLVMGLLVATRLRVPGPRPQRRGRSSSVPPMRGRYGDVRPASSRPPARCGPP